MPVEKTESDHVRLVPTTATTELVLPQKVWNGLTSKIKSGEYAVNDKDGNPQPVAPEPYRYGDGPNDYIAVTFEPSVVLVRDGNDPRGLALQFTHAEWARFGGVDTDDEDEIPSEKVDNLRDSNDPTKPTTNEQNPDAARESSGKSGRPGASAKGNTKN